MLLRAQKNIEFAFGIVSDEAAENFELAGRKGLQFMTPKIRIQYSCSKSNKQFCGFYVKINRKKFLAEECFVLIWAA